MIEDGCPRPRATNGSGIGSVGSTRCTQRQRCGRGSSTVSRRGGSRRSSSARRSASGPAGSRARRSRCWIGCWSRGARRGARPVVVESGAAGGRWLGEVRRGSFAKRSPVFRQYNAETPAVGGGFVVSGLVGLGGLEPPASSLSGMRSNRLSYRPVQLLPVEKNQGATSRNSTRSAPLTGNRLALSTRCSRGYESASFKVTSTPPTRSAAML
jgi:hypothetical protein